MENKEKDLYLAKLLEENAIKQDEFEDIEYKPEINAFCSKYLSAIFIDNINFGWSVWQAKAPPEGFVLVPKEVLNKSKRVVTLTCSELFEAFQFGAPDGESDEDQMATEMTIEWLEEGHSGKGYYAYYSELPEEGAIKLGEENDNDNSN